MSINSGNMLKRSLSVAAITPRSVIIPLMSRRGVTSKAGFAAGLSCGTRRIFRVSPCSSMPEIWVTSSSARSSMGI